MNPLLPGYSGATPEPTRNALRNNQGTNEDDSQNDYHPEAGLFHGQTTRNNGPEESHDNNGCDSEPEIEFVSKRSIKKQSNYCLLLEFLPSRSRDFNQWAETCILPVISSENPLVEL